MDEKVYIGDEDGEVAVFRHSSDPRVAMVGGEPLAVNQMLSSVYSTPVVANGVLYVTTRNLLYAIQQRAR